MTKNPTLFWGLIASMWAGNLMLFILNLPLVGLWVKLLTIPYRYLFPAIMVFCSIGVYSINSGTKHRKAAAMIREPSAFEALLERVRWLVRDVAIPAEASVESCDDVPEDIVAVMRAEGFSAGASPRALAGPGCPPSLISPKKPGPSLNHRVVLAAGRPHGGSKPRRLQDVVERSGS